MLRVCGLLLAAVVVTSGCTPSGFLARQFVRAPKSFPKIVSPAPRVYYSVPRKAFRSFPLQLATVGSPPVTLAYRLVPPADYQARMVTTQYWGAGAARPLYEHEATFPGKPTPFSAKPRGTIVLLHGYGLDQDTQLPWALFLAQAGWSCVLVDLRGHGESSGDRIYFGIQEARDLSALMSELSERGQSANRFSVLGVSYGAAVALRWSTIDSRVDGVIAITPYGRLVDAVEGLRSSFAAWLPAGVIRRAAEKMPNLVGAAPNGLDPREWLRDKPVNALFVAASHDPVAPVESVEALAASAQNGTVLRLPGVSHEEAPFQLEPLLEVITTWLQAKSAGNPGANAPD